MEQYTCCRCKRDYDDYFYRKHQLYLVDTEEHTTEDGVNSVNLCPSCKAQFFHWLKNEESKNGNV